MDTDKLKQFCVIVETGGLVQSAKIIGISPSGLSKSMQKLQEELGITLFSHSGRGITITDQGLEVYKKSHPLLNQVHLLKNIAQAKGQVIKIGAMEVFCHSFLGEILLKKFPCGPIELSELRPGEIERMLIEQKIDFGITYFPQALEGIDYKKIKSTQLKVCIKRSKTPDSDSTPEQGLKFVTPLSLTTPHFTDLYDRDGWPDLKIPRDSEFKCNRLSTALNAVLCSDFAILIPQFLLEAMSDKLMEIPFNKKGSLLKRDIFIVKRTSTAENEIFHTLSKQLRQLR